MNNLSRLRVAWLLPSLERGFYWQPVLSMFTQLFPHTIVFTGFWPGFAAGFEDTFAVRVLRKPKVIETTQVSTGTGRAFVFSSMGIIGHLLSFNPHVIFASAFSIWTALALLLKPWGKWRVVIAYDGSSPNVDCRDSSLRSFSRRAMARLADAFITNSGKGKAYLTEILRAEESCVFVRPYQVPTPKMLLRYLGETNPIATELERPVFLSVCQIVSSKGLHLLLEAFALLRNEGCRQWTLFIVGDGPQRSELEDLIKRRGLGDRVKLVGWVSYGNLGTYFQEADVFIFPTLEDVWGMALLEAMALGKPVLCSKWAGTAEMVADDENGYIIDPYQPGQVAALMKRFIDNPSLIQPMGECSKQIMASHTPEAAAKYLAGVTAIVLDKLKETYA